MQGNTDDGFMGRLPGDAIFPIPRGWVLDLTDRIDAVAAGFMRRMCRARLAWRQGCWAALSIGAIDDPDFLVRATGSADWLDASASDLILGFAELSITMSARQLIEAAFHSCPPGYLGVLRKLHGEAPAYPAFYAHLHRVFSSNDPRDRLRARSLQQVGGLNETKIEAALALQDVALLTPVALTRFHSVQTALVAEAQAAAARRLNVHLTDDDISAAFAAGREGFQPWFYRLLRQSKPEHALPTDSEPDLDRVDGENAKQIGMAMGNCLDVERVMPRALSGIWSLVHWRPENIVFALRRFDIGWAVTEVHLPRNAGPSASDVRKVADRVRPLGILCPVPADPEPNLRVLSDAFGGWKIGDVWDFDEG